MIYNTFVNNISPQSNTENKSTYLVIKGIIRLWIVENIVGGSMRQDLVLVFPGNSLIMLVEVGVQFLLEKRDSQPTKDEPKNGRINKSLFDKSLGK